MTKVLEVVLKVPGGCAEGGGGCSEGSFRSSRLLRNSRAAVCVTCLFTAVAAGRVATGARGSGSIGKSDLGSLHGLQRGQVWGSLHTLQADQVWVRSVPCR